MMMRGLLIATAALAISMPAQAQGTVDAPSILSVAKLTGACGIMDAMIHFQKTTRLPGGDEFVARFWAVEAARLGVTVKQPSDRCDAAVKSYNSIWSAATH
ncbi:MAG: hypothetical protein J0H89_02945 [Rhizobiales bacterium]|nr:hypothetical protein [Hyphomicrobiales bacterium]